MSVIGVNDKIPCADVQYKTFREIIKSKDLELIRSLLAFRECPIVIGYGEVYFQDEIHFALDRIVRKSPNTFPNARQKYTERRTRMILEQQECERNKKIEAKERARKTKERLATYEERDRLIEEEYQRAKEALEQARLEESIDKYTIWGGW